MIGNRSIKGKVIFWASFFAALAGGLAWAFWPRTLPVETASVRRGSHEQQVTEEGKTRAREIYKIYSSATGQLKRVEFHPGDKVEKGTLLATVFRPPDWEIRSPVEGKILRVQRESEGPIERGDVIMEVADNASLEIVSEILTEEAVEIKPGAPVRIESGGACKPLEGKVRRMEPSAFTKVSALGVEEQRVNVIVDFISPLSECEGISDGFRVNIHIITRRFKDVLTIPTGALFRQGEEWAVFKKVDGKARIAPVKISRKNPERTMLEEGLKEGETVIVYPSDEIKEGTRVRAL